ncbi:MAG TPA: hypothetical protein DER60_07135 [Syntrophomonas sp.]|jgi:hypothetical protein|nr:hypothetical protein [Syntrophomonas sp.]
MNKIKLLYDVARVMREKEAWNGAINISGMKGDAESFHFDNEFSRDLVSGTSKARISSVVDHGGRRIKHESTTEFDMHQDDGQGRAGGKAHCFFHQHHGHHGCGHGLGLKEKLDGLVAMLGALNDMQVVEQEDKSLLLSLDLKNIPEALLVRFHAKMPHEHLGHRGLLQSSPAMESGSLECRINPRYEVETVKVHIKGKLQEENDQSHEFTLNAGISFTW